MGCILLAAGSFLAVQAQPLWSLQANALQSVSSRAESISVSWRASHTAMTNTMPVTTSQATARQLILAQMSRWEHDQLRLELREGMHRPVKVGPLDELGFGRLTIRERRLLREQLRRQSEPGTEDAAIPVIGESLRNEPRPQTTDAAIATIAVPESVDVSRPVLDSSD